MLEKFTLDERKLPVPCKDDLQWARWMARDDRRVALDVFGEGDDEFEVSTVFLGLNHNHLPGGRPLLFETMVFAKFDVEVINRYSTWQEAEIGHQSILTAVYSLISSSRELSLNLIKEFLYNAHHQD